MKHSTIFFCFMMLTIVLWLASNMVNAQTDFWQPVSSTALGAVIAKHPDGSIYVTGAGGLYHSTDNGLSWTAMVVPDPHIMTLFIHSNGDIYLGMDCGDTSIYRSTDDGNSWLGLNNPAPIIISILVSSSGTIFAGAMSSYSDKGLYQSNDGGATWTKLTRFKHLIGGERSVSQLLLGPTGQIFMATHYGGAFVSRTNGRTWRKLGLPNMQSISLSLGSNGELVAACIAGRSGDQGRVYLSSNLGKQWKRIDGKMFPVYGLTSAVIVGNTIFVGSVWNGVFQSTNLGASWTQVNSGFPLPNMWIDNFGISNDNHILALACRRPYRSADPISTNHTGVVVENDFDELLAKFLLQQNYPNPFNPTTTISFTLPEDALVTLKVYNSLGQEVATLAERGEFTEGDNELEFDATGLPSGVYFYRLTAKGISDDEGTKGQVFTITRKMLLVK